MCEASSYVRFNMGQGVGKATPIRLPIASSRAQECVEEWTCHHGLS